MVINVGNGHRMDVPDQAVALATEIDVDDKGNPINVHPFLRIADPKTRTAVAMMPSTVPMPFARGMVVMCARYAGSDIKLRGKDYKIITQAHVIAVFTGIKMQVGAPTESLPIVEMSDKRRGPGRCRRVASNLTTNWPKSETAWLRGDGAARARGSGESLYHVSLA